MDLSCIAVLVEAVQQGSLAAAARRLGLAPMAASRKLAALEDELGVRLVHRTTRSLALTSEGEAFLPYAQAMLENESDGRASVRSTGAGASGLLRVTTSVPFGRKIVAPMVPGFMRDNPEVRVDLMMSDNIVDIVGLGIDVAIRIALLKDSTLVAHRLADSPRCLYAAPEYLAAHGMPGSVADLETHQCLAITGVTHWMLLTRGRPVRQRVAGRFSANSVEGLLEACIGGLGIANLSRWNVDEHVSAGRLVAIELPDTHPEPLAVWAVFPTARMVPPKVRLFVAALRGHLNGRYAPPAQ